MTLLPLAPGSRVALANNFGTIRFLDSLPNRGDGVLWAGIDWDDPTRGKHDGTVDGVRRFIAAHPTSGSFVKLSKLRGCVRRSLLDAVAVRHGGGDDGDGVREALPETVGGVGGKTDFLGVDEAVLRQGSVTGATSLTLRRLGVCCVEEPGVLGGALSSLRVLDLADSLLCDLRDVVRLFRAFPSLHTLDLSGNRFELGTGAGKVPGNGMCSAVSASMRVLVLNRCNLSWSTVLALCSACPALEELRLHRAGLSSLLDGDVRCPGEDVLPCSSQPLKHLRLVDLSGNGLSWNHLVAAFGSLPSLESMFVSENAIGLIRFPSIQAEAPYFPSLVSLSLSGNPIDDWRSVSELSVLPNLTALRVSDIPLLEADTANAAAPGDLSSLEGRNGVIARIGKLAVLNGSSVEPDERVYAEKRYLTSCLAQLPGSKIAESVLLDHPRLPELCKEYDMELSRDEGGGLVHSADDAASGGVRRGGSRGRSNYRPLRADLIHCSFVNHGGFSACAPGSVKVQLPASISVGRLAGIAARLFGGISSVDVKSLELVDNAGQAQERVAQLSDETRDLRHFGLDGGEAVCINVRGRGK